MCINQQVCLQAQVGHILRLQSYLTISLTTITELSWGNILIGPLLRIKAGLIIDLCELTTKNGQQDKATGINVTNKAAAVSRDRSTGPLDIRLQEGSRIGNQNYEIT